MEIAGCGRKAWWDTLKDVKAISRQLPSSTLAASVFSALANNSIYYVLVIPSDFSRNTISWIVVRNFSNGRIDGMEGSLISGDPR